ncbi:MAG: carbamate kinase [Deltaproteobacteria bacterium]|nr:MAG: carbamate kinase [Deltaproteobacteria bacterium]
MRVVIALGGNALLRRNEPPEAQIQRRNVARAADAVAAVAAQHGVVVTHGNGPQVGLLALQAESFDRVSPYPLDVLGAETEGMIGYLIDQELSNRLPDRQVATLLTQVEVDPSDPGFSKPSKPIGPVYGEAEARRLASERGWTVRPDGDGYRRVVASPEPKRILELPTIRLLVDAAAIVICAGGGGIPVAVSETGGIRGVEAVIDKDLAAARLAIDLDADALLLLTDVDAVYADWDERGRGARNPFGHVSPAELAQHRFEPGTMGPKVEAACRFASQTGGRVGIGNLEDAAAILEGRAGTTVRDPEAARRAH